MLGFTMIELLIVISILGILAVAVLSAINPVEQINRGRDTGSRSDAEQLLSALDRYNASQGYFAWITGPTALSFALVWTDVNEDSWTVSGDATCPVLTRLGSTESVQAGCVNTDELKSSFATRISPVSYNTLHIYNSGDTGASTYVCFKPLSKAFAAEAATRVAGDLPDDYPADAVANTTDCGPAGNCICLP